MNINKPVHFHDDTASRKKLYVGGGVKNDCVRTTDSQSNAGKCVTIFVVTFLNKSTTMLKVLKSNQIPHGSSDDRQQQAKLLTVSSCNYMTFSFH